MRDGHAVKRPPKGPFRESSGVSQEGRYLGVCYWEGQRSQRQTGK